MLKARVSLGHARGAIGRYLQITHPTDLTWLLHRAAQRTRAALDQVAQVQGLTGVRDWIVLSALIAGPGRTQPALGHALGLDKTTLTSLLDRLE